MQPEKSVGLTLLGKLVVLFFVLGCVAGGFYLLSGKQPLETLRRYLGTGATDTAVPGKTPGAPATYAFRVKGSSTIAKAMTVMAEAYRAGGGPPVEVVSESTGKGFEALRAGEVPLAMASRPIKAEEDAAMGGAMTDPSHEHVIGIDAVAVVVNTRNPLRKMTVAVFRDILSGVVTRWEDVEGSDYRGEIHVYGYADTSGIQEIVKGAVLRGTAPIAPRKIAANGDDESALVEGDPLAVGYVSLAFTNRNRAVALSDGPGVPPFYPNRFTVATESYPITRRLLVYSAPGTTRPEVAAFLDFIKGDKGQAIIGKTFVPLTLAASTELGYREADEGPIARRYPGASRLSTDFRFRSGSARLDTKALGDIGRIVGLIERNPGKRLLLFGFADSIGGAEANLRLSRERAQVVADELIMNGLKVETIDGFGSAHPVADNATPEGRERNRRVEIWIK